MSSELILVLGGASEVTTQDDTIFVSGMDPEITENDINDHFGSIGIIKKDRRTQKPKIWIYRNKETGAGKGECTITYDDPSAASSAIDWFDGKVILSLSSRLHIKLITFFTFAGLQWKQN